MHMGNKLVVAWASLVIRHSCDVMPEGCTCGTRAQATTNTCNVGTGQNQLWKGECWPGSVLTYLVEVTTKIIYEAHDPK